MRLWRSRWLDRELGGWGRQRAGELRTVCRDGKAYVYGYVPIVVAKCGMMLKETGAPHFAVPGCNH